NLIAPLRQERGDRAPNVRLVVHEEDLSLRERAVPFVGATLDDGQHDREGRPASGLARDVDRSPHSANHRKGYGQPQPGPETAVVALRVEGIEDAPQGLRANADTGVGEGDLQHSQVSVFVTGADAPPDRER